MQHDRAMPLAILADITGVESLREHAIKLQGAALPGSADRVMQMKFDLGAVKRTFAGKVGITQPRPLQRRAQGTLRAIPDRVGSVTLLGAQGQLDVDLVEAERLVDAELEADIGLAFGNDLILCAEDMGVVLGEGANPHDAVQRARRLVAMAGPEFRITQRQIAIALQALAENLDMARAIHRLDTGNAGALVMFDLEHVGAVHVPVS